MMEIYEARAKALPNLDGEIEGVYEESDYYKCPSAVLGGMSNTSLSSYKAVFGKISQCKMDFCFDAQTAMDAWRWQKAWKD